MSNAKKAYLIERNPRCGGLALTVQPVLVVFHDKAAKTATVVPLGVRGETPWISPNATARTVRADALAGTRLRALAKIALALADIETLAAAELAFPVVPAPSESPAMPEPTAGGRRRDGTPWWKRD